MTPIPDWHYDEGGAVVAVRDAEHWQARDDGAVECSLCYRKCVLVEGEAGWCGYRRNEGGQMTIPDHGVLARCQRQMLGYRGGNRFFYPGARALALGLTRCTAACAFCSSSAIVHRPDALAWLGGTPRQLGYDGGWHYAKAMAHPEAVVTTALSWGAQAIVFAENEPLLSFEYTLDVCRLAKIVGLAILIYTNGFSTPEAIERLAPYVDCVDLGIKGSADPDFYDQWMRSAGAVEHVLASARAWKEAGVLLIVSDLIAPAQMQTDEAQCAAQHALYPWIAAELGPETPLLIGPMVKPALIRGERERGPNESPFIQGAGDTEGAYAMRIGWALGRAQAAGLPYAHILAYGDSGIVRCHACQAPLLTIREPAACATASCAMFETYCNCWSTQLAVERVDNRRGRCAHCGATVPIVPGGA